MQPSAPPMPAATGAPAGGSRSAVGFLAGAGVAIVTALAVFAVLYAAFGNREDVVVVVTPPSTSAPGTTAPPPGVIEPAKVVKSRIGDAGEIETIPIQLHQGDALRVKVVPSEDDFDPVLGLAMPQRDLVPDFFEEGFRGNLTQLFREQYQVLYSDTEIPASIAPIMAADNNGEGFGEWLVFVAPVDAEYSIVVRGRGDTVGSYSLTTQVKTSTGSVKNVDRLPNHDGWMDRDAAATRLQEAVAFLTDPSFYDEPQFRDGSDYLGPDKESAARTFRG